MAGVQQLQIRGLYRLIEETVEAQPAAPALVAGAERVPVSYAELATLVDDLSDVLSANGLRPGDLVALEAANSVEFVAGLLGAARAGLVVAPLDSALAPGERSARLDRLGARLILTDALTDFTNGDCPTWRISFTPGRAGLRVVSVKPRKTPTTAPHLSADDRLIMFTAGTTGEPKMVPWTCESIATSIRDVCTVYQLNAADTTVGVMPFFHGHGLIAGLLAPLASGGSVLLPASSRFSAHTFWDDLNAAKATWFTAVPTILEILLARADTDGPRVMPGLRFVRTSSAPLNPTTAEAFQQLVGAPVLAAYGMTETTHQAASQPLAANGPDKPDSVGMPTGVDIRVVGAEGRDCPTGTAGEIWVKGPIVTRGYLEDEADTAASFTDGWYHTGDLGTVDADGYLTVTGRIKTLINRGGEKIAPEHVEEILDQFPGVEESAVLGQPDPILGERVVALVVPENGRDIQLTDVVAYCRDRLARYEVPQDLKVVSAIPHTSKGAIDRLAALFAYQHLIYQHVS
jgi:acyl-CoA synthetase (AMP-forming)/AMP-acid ligase II